MCKCDYGNCSDECVTTPLCRCHIAPKPDLQEFQDLKTESAGFMAVVEKYVPHWQMINCPPWTALEMFIQNLQEKK